MPSATFIFLAVLAGAPAQAEPISFDFSVTVTDGSVRPPVASTVQVGDTFTGSLSFEHSEDSNPDPNVLFSEGTGAVVLGLNPLLRLNSLFAEVVNGPSLSGLASDRALFVFQTVGFFGPDLIISEVAFTFEDPSGQTLSDVNVTAEALAAFPIQRFRFVVGEDEGPETLTDIRGDLRLLNTPEPVPEPATLLLFATGAVAIGRQVRTRRKLSAHDSGAMLIQERGRLDG